MVPELLLVEELENRLAIEGVNYKREFEDNWEEVKFSPTYFDEFISGPLLNEFVKAIYERIDPLNNKEINKYLSLSLQQFETHTPEKRERNFILNYWHTYWYPNRMDDNVGDHDRKYALHILKHYASHFHLYKVALEKIYTAFKEGLIDSPAATPAMKIQDQDFRQFIKSLTYNYPIYGTPLNMYYEWKLNLFNFKQEVLGNLIHMEIRSRRPYLNKLKFELEEKLQHGHTSQEELNSLYQKYKTSEAELLANRSFTNPLHISLNDEPPKFREKFEEGFNPDTENIQFTFYNYHYSKSVISAIEFLNEQYEGVVGAVVKLQPQPKRQPQQPIKSISTNLQSFSYKENNTGQTNVTDLMKFLKTKTLIKEDTELKHFRRIFSGNAIERKVIWTGTISQLAYFIKQLHNQSGKIKDTKQKQWDITINCFEMADGSELNNDKLRRQKRPAGYSLIDDAVAIL